MGVMDCNEYLLYLENVRKAFGEKVVLEDIDLRVREGELVTVVGPSGCGKSTLLRIILGEEREFEGTATLAGKDIGYPDSSRGIVYQRYSLFPHLTVLQNVLAHATFDGPLWSFVATKRRREEALEFLRRVRLDEHVHKYPHELSGGMQQRVAIAQALIARPRILLMDEPFGALDPTVREAMQVFVLELWEETGMTIFFVTHDLEEAVYLGTRVLVLSQYYTDNRPNASPDNAGARIVADYCLPRKVMPTVVKGDGSFRTLVDEIRARGFDPELVHYLTDFNLKHPDSFQTLDGDSPERIS
jgi:NitT/TauT family transport system ATP-binding protein